MCARHTRELDEAVDRFEALFGRLPKHAAEVETGLELHGDWYFASELVQLEVVGDDVSVVPIGVGPCT